MTPMHRLISTVAAGLFYTPVNRYDKIRYFFKRICTGVATRNMRTYVDILGITVCTFHVYRMAREPKTQ